MELSYHQARAFVNLILKAAEAQKEEDNAFTTTERITAEDKFVRAVEGVQEFINSDILDHAS